MTKPADFYSSRIETYTKRLSNLRKKINTISAFRMACFLALLAAAYFSFRHPTGVLFVASAVLLLLFLWLVRMSVSLNFARRLAQKILYVNQNEINVLKGNENGFPYQVDVYEREMHTSDLDIFGKNSIFHLLNRTTTSYGKSTLSSLLNKTPTDPKKITDQQQAVKTLSDQQEKLQIITAHGLLQEEEEADIKDLASWMANGNQMAGKTWLNVARFILPLISIGGFLYYLDADNPVPLGIGVVLCWIVTGVFLKYIHIQHQLTGKKQIVLEQYASVLKHFNHTKPGDSTLLNKLHTTAQDAHHAIFRLSKLSGLLDQRLNLLVNFFLNSFLLYDVHVMIALEKWKEKYSGHFNDWIDAVGEIETLSSISTFAFNNPSYCYPAITEGKPFIIASQLSHPLIPGKEQVANDITAGDNEKLLLVTGSNMSGKSTFLRTLGVNILLAQCGAPVCAVSFTCTPMKILSSIRISDSLQDNTSYFMAELKRLKQIIYQLETSVPALVLIDEVLRGTNSDDKTHGSASLIVKLLKYNCLALFATHDLSLSTLEQTYPGQVSNYCFESTIENGELFFDYKLHRGVATNKNASFLMHKMGII